MRSSESPATLPSTPESQTAALFNCICQTFWLFNVKIKILWDHTVTRMSSLLLLFLDDIFNVPCHRNLFYYYPLYVQDGNSTVSFMTLIGVSLVYFVDFVILQTISSSDSWSFSPSLKLVVFMTKCEKKKYKNTSKRIIILKQKKVQWTAG